MSGLMRRLSFKEFVKIDRSNPDEYVLNGLKIPSHLFLPSIGEEQTLWLNDFFAMPPGMKVPVSGPWKNHLHVCIMPVRTAPYLIPEEFLLPIVRR
jgi:hypothetical protein